MGCQALCCISRKGKRLSARLMKILKDYSVFLGVVAFALISLIVCMMLPSASIEPSEEVPWNIEQTQSGMRVFGLTLRHSTLKEAQSKFQEHAEVSLFASDSNQLAAEAYFDQVNLGGLRAKVVLTAALSQTELQGMYDRGIRISGMSNGRKIELHPDDRLRVENTTIASINYLPSASLAEEVLTQRFGMPARRVREEKNEVLHLLYPQRGLDIALNSKNKAVFQYVTPAEFDALMAPLLALEQAK